MSSSPIPPTLHRSLLYTLVSYLQNLKQSGNYDSESLDTVLPVLSETFAINLADSDQQQQYAQPYTLPAIFQAGVQALKDKADQETKKKPQPASKSQQAVTPPASSSSSSTKPKKKSFDEFVKYMVEKDFFAGLSEGTPEYNKRMEKLKEKYIAKYDADPNAVSSSVSPSSAASSSTSSDTKQTMDTENSDATEMDDGNASDVVVDEKAKAQAEQLKSEGNKMLTDGQHEAAAKLYSQAIQLNPKNHIYYANRAAAYVNLRNFDNAINDSNRAIKLDPTYAKAYYRLGQAASGLSKWQEAVNAFELAVKYTEKPSDKAPIQQQLQQAKAKLGGSSDPMGGLDFGALLNNPAISNLMGQLGGGGGGDLSGVDFNALMKDPTIMSLAQQFIGGGGQGGMGATGGSGSSSTSGPSSSGSSPSSSASTSSASLPPVVQQLLNNPELQRLRDTDPEIAAVYRDVQQNGQTALFKYMNNPSVMGKIQGIVQSLMGNIMGGPQGDPKTVQNVSNFKQPKK
jgi:small glutamine-rich tetratricopeptide repeat-containing protein alpha